MFSLYFAAAFCALLLGAWLFIHLAYRIPRHISSDSPASYGMPSEEIWFINAKGKRLFSWFIHNNAEAPLIIILHGWASCAEHMLPLAKPLFQEGFNLLLLDARNHGLSDSDGHSSLPRFADDLKTAITDLQTTANTPNRKYNGKIILMGHSVGAGAVLYEASRRQDICAVISIAAFAHPAVLMRRQLQRYHLPHFLIGWVLRYIEWLIGVPFEKIAPMNTICRINCPVLLMHGEADKAVPIADAHTIFENDKSGSKKSMRAFISVKEAGHADVDKIAYATSEIISFLAKTDCSFPQSAE